MANPQQLAIRNASITVETDGGARAILDNVTASFRRGEFVGIVGGSGSGKSTLIKSLAGINKLTRGEVLLGRAPIAREDLLGDRRIAYLPQDVVIHEKLTPLRALDYIARLKNAGRTSEERVRIIGSVIEATGMTAHIHTPIWRLSGGQRKRVALAAELIGDPDILLLDEVTSGLDPATDEEMMKLFRRLADRGKTVICITHAPENLRFCDRVLYVMQGKVIFSGPLTECLRFFHARAIKEVYEIQKRAEPKMWQARFHKYYGRPEPVEEASPVRAAAPRRNLFDQLVTLTRRYTRLQLTDPVSCFFLFLQTALIALLVCMFGGISPEKSLGDQAGTIKGVIFTMLLSMLWCAGTSSVREIVKERAILAHEIRFGVKAGVWLLSKLLFLFAVVLVQALLMLAVVRLGTHLPCPFGRPLWLLIFTGFSGVAVGLLVSALSKNAERAMVILPIILIAQAIFAGVLFDLAGVTKFIAKLFVPAYWSLQGLTGTFSQELREAGVSAENLILGYGTGFLSASLELLLMTAVPLILTSWLLAAAYAKTGKAVIRCVHGAALLVCVFLIFAAGFAAESEEPAGAESIAEIDFTYHEAELIPRSESLGERVRRTAALLEKEYSAYQGGEGEGLARAVNLLENLKARDREVYRSEDRTFVRIRERVESARAGALSDTAVCPKTERLRQRVLKNAEALENLYNAFIDGKDPNGVQAAYNYLKNLEVKDKRVYDYADPNETRLKEIREKVEKAHQLLGDEFEKVREGILRYDQGAADGTERLKTAKERLEELLRQYPVLKMHATADSLAEQIRTRYRDSASEQVREKIEEALDESRNEEFADLETPPAEEMPAEPNLAKIDTRRKTPEQILEEKERIVSRAQEEAREALARQKAKIRRRLDDGLAGIDGKLDELGGAVDRLVGEFESLKEGELEKNLRGEIAFERNRLKTLLALRVYELSEFPDFLDEAAAAYDNLEVPAGTGSREPLLTEARQALEGKIYQAREKEARRARLFREEYDTISSALDEGEKVPKSRLADLRGRIRTGQELESYFELQEKAAEAVGVPRLPEEGSEPGETVTLTIRGAEFSFAWCPPGTFMMGSPEEEPDRRPDELPHKVTLTEGFWILRTEVTQKMYAAVMESTPPSWQSPANEKFIKEFVYNLVKKGMPEEKAKQTAKRLKYEQFPVESIDRAQAIAFCQRLNKLFHVKPEEGNFFFALPSEAQWEYACRAGESGPFATERLKISNADYRVTFSGITFRMKECGAGEVDRNAAQENAWHISEMHGNVSEWCRDLYAEYPSGDAADPLVRKGGDEYVVRGGSWNIKEGGCRSAARGHMPDGSREKQIGFRVVITRK